MFNNFRIFLNKHHIFSDSQFVLHPSHSTELAVIDVIDNQTQITANQETSLDVFIDLSYLAYTGIRSFVC